MKLHEIKTKVIFRKYKDNGEILAVFPEIPATPSGHYPLCYAHIGQHGSVDYEGLLNNTTLASEDEYEDLLQELKSIGYNLDIKKKETYEMTQIRYELAKEV